VKLPDNALGVSDAMQFHDCPKLFHKNMLRHTPSDVDEQAVTGMSYPLAFGQALHESALAVVKNPDIYIDDAVDIGWRRWGYLLKPGDHAELKEDVAVVIQRTLEAENLELVEAEQDWKVPLFIGSKNEESDEEEGKYYYYRFKIDALYRDKRDPTHYVIRDFKTYRGEKFQNDIDSMMQFTAYDYGVRQAVGEGVERVTIWVDQTKHGEVFSSRNASDRVKFEEWMTSAIKSILAIPEEEVANTFKLNQWCSYCPLLASCAVVDYANDFALAQIANERGFEDSAKYTMAESVEKYETAKQAAKVLDEYTKLVSSWLKKNPGKYGNVSYYPSYVSTQKFSAKDVYEIVGEEIFECIPDLSKKALKSILQDEGIALELLKVAKSSGYQKINAKDLSK
jgi:hypothetical protein